MNFKPVEVKREYSRVITPENMPMIKFPLVKRLLGGVALILLGCFFFRGCGGNSLIPLGFPLDNSAIIIDESPVNLKGQEIFVKANLTQAQANVLRKSFRAEPSAETESGDGKVFPTSPKDIFPTSPKDIQPLPGNEEWRPQTVKKYWSGSFVKAEGNDNWHCQYIFDIGNPNQIVLYFYGITFDD